MAKPTSLAIRNALTLDPEKVDLKLWGDIAFSMALESGDDEESEEFLTETTVQSVARRFAIPPKEALAVVAHPKFAEFFHNVQMAAARSEFDRHAFRRMVDVVRRGSDRNAIAAATKLAKWFGYEKEKSAVTLNLSIESAVKGGSVIDVTPDYKGAA